MASRFLAWLKEKKLDKKERKEFERLLEEECRPLRREAYREERLKLSITEGKNIAKDEIDKINKRREEKKNPPKDKKGGFDMSSFSQPLFK